MSEPREESAAVAPPTREELVTMVARAHQGSAYGEASAAGRALAAQSKLPKVIAENLGAGFGQWDFFPEATEIVEFALAHVPPSTEEELWTFVRTWASDDAAERHTLVALVGREIAQHELRRIPVPKLRELFDETRPTAARALREALGLAVRALPPAKPEPKRKATASPAKRAQPAAAPAAPREIPATPAKMPKPELKRTVKAEAAPPAKRFHHPKFGEGALESQDGVGPDAKLTIKFAGGAKTLLARYVTEIPT